MSIPDRFKNAKIDNSIRLESNKSWYLWGKPGRGKTHFIYALMLRRNDEIEKIREKEKNIHIHFPVLSVINWVDYVDTVRYSKFEDKSEKVNGLMNVHKLIIDDIGVEKKSEFSDTILYRVINHRYDWNKYTAFTSNLKISELDYDGRIISRIIGIVGENKFEIIGKDHRV